MPDAPKVLNMRDRPVSSNAVYIGRPSKWGNPYLIGRDGTREEVIAKYQNYILGNDVLLLSLPELRGKDLICFCSPLPCHGDVLLSLANKS